MDLPGMGGWNLDWEEEIAKIQRERQQEHNKNLAKKEIIFVKDDKVHIEVKYFTELTRQMRHKANVIVSTFPQEKGYCLISSKGYLQLQKFIPLPPWAELNIQR